MDIYFIGGILDPIHHKQQISTEFLNQPELQCRKFSWHIWKAFKNDFWEVSFIIGGGMLSMWPKDYYHHSELHLWCHHLINCQLTIWHDVITLAKWYIAKKKQTQFKITSKATRKLLRCEQTTASSEWCEKGGFKNHHFHAKNICKHLA